MMVNTSPNPLSEQYRCPPENVPCLHADQLPTTRGFFRFGKSGFAYGRCASGSSPHPNRGLLVDASQGVSLFNGTARLPFNLAEVVGNLRLERYVSGRIHPLLRRAYYSLRPFLSDTARACLKRVVLRGWQANRFPRWPVDFSVEDLFRELLRLFLQQNPSARIPFIWFWPDGAPGCVAMTHDVETVAGRDWCSTLMDINDSYGVKASFQLVPEERYAVDREWVKSIWARGFEVNVQDLNHDGRLFEDYHQFQRRAKLIDHYATEFGAAGFRAAVLYRNPDWISALNVSYDMSVPNVAHLDPQHGGCCTVMPFFIGDILELPLTTTQDYMLFYILRQFSCDLWKQQTELILSQNGLATFLVHPDYLQGLREQVVYRSLLAYLQSLAHERNVWIALPGEVNSWWRARRQMTLVNEAGGWRIRGKGSERASVGYVRLNGDEVVYQLQQSPAANAAETCHLQYFATAVSMS